MAEEERNVVLAIDASEQAEHAFGWYVKTIHKPDSHLILVHIPELLDADRSRGLFVSSTAWEEAIKKEQAKVKELEQKYNTKILEQGISGKIRTEGGSSKPGEVICRVAEEEKATMIVMGTRGLGKIRRTILGSVSDFVVHHAHCPVIVCRQ